MRLPNRVVFKGVTFRRPTKSSYKVWAKPARDKGARDQEGFGRRERIATKLWHTNVEFYNHWYNGEGWSSFDLFVCFDTGEATLTTGGSDCDGEQTFKTDYKYIKGQWVKVGSEQYDQYAEKMGY